MRPFALFLELPGARLPLLIRVAGTASPHDRATRGPLTLGEESSKIASAYNAPSPLIAKLRDLPQGPEKLHSWVCFQRKGGGCCAISGA